MRAWLWVVAAGALAMLATRGARAAAVEVVDAEDEAEPPLAPLLMVYRVRAGVGVCLGGRVGSERHAPRRKGLRAARPATLRRARRIGRGGGGAGLGGGVAEVCVQFVPFESDASAVLVNETFKLTYQLINIGNQCVGRGGGRRARAQRQGRGGRGCGAAARRDAHDVSLIDDNWPTDSFEVVSGALNKHWAEIKAQSLETYEVKLRAKKTGAFQADPARVEMFASPSGSSASADEEIKREALSSAFGIIYVLDANEYARATDRTSRNWLIFAAAAVSAVATPLYLWTTTRATLKAKAT
jgi:Translocon-associated protein beta (TRAPB)